MRTPCGSFRRAGLVAMQPTGFNSLYVDCLKASKGLESLYVDSTITFKPLNHLSKCQSTCQKAACTSWVPTHEVNYRGVMVPVSIGPNVPIWYFLFISWFSTSFHSRSIHGVVWRCVAA